MSISIDPEIYQRMVALRRDLHRHPELSWQEGRTSGRIVEELERLEIPYERVGATGVVGEIAGASAYPKVALRADIDALPIPEETGLPFASEVPGVMHACGHDGHMSILFGAAEILRRRDDLPANVRLIFQPAEEVGAGAKSLIEAGVLDDVAMIFGGHLDRHYPTGQLIVTEGPVNASTDAFRIEISGRAGHAARPHETVDAVVVGSLMVMAIQTVVSREVNPAFPAVVSVGRFDAGTVGNAIAGQAVLEGTIRTQHAEVQDHFRKSIRRIAESAGKLHDASVRLTFRGGVPAVTNGPEMVGLAREAAAYVVGEHNVGELAFANMGGEDFGYYMEKIPGCYVRYGARIEGGQNCPAHSSKFDFDETAMGWAACWLAEIAQRAGRVVREVGPELAVST